MTLYRPRDRLLKVEFYWICFVNSPAEAFAKYFDEYVCVSVCPWGYLWNHSHDLYQICCACCLCPRLVLLRHVDDRPHRLSAGKGWQQCTAWAKCNLWLPCLFLKWWPGLQWEGIWVSQSKSTSSSPYSKLWTLPFLHLFCPAWVMLSVLVYGIWWSTPWKGFCPSLCFQFCQKLASCYTVWSPYKIIHHQMHIHATCCMSVQYSNNLYRIWQFLSS